MKITQLQSNIFEFKNNKYQTQTKRFINFEHLQKEIDRWEKLGKNNLFILSINTLEYSNELWIQYKVI